MECRSDVYLGPAAHQGVIAGNPGYVRTGDGEIAVVNTDADPAVLGTYDRQRFNAVTLAMAIYYATITTPWDQAPHAQRQSFITLAQAVLDRLVHDGVLA